MNKITQGLVAKYHNEQVTSDYTYPKYYRGLKSLGEQVEILSRKFDLSVGYAIDWLIVLHLTLRGESTPFSYENWVALPSVEAVAKRHFPHVDPDRRYCYAVDMVCEMIGRTRNFHNYLAGKTDPSQLRQSARTVQALNIIAKAQGHVDCDTGYWCPNEILFIPVQYGMRHRGRSSRCAGEYLVGAERSEDMIPRNEFGLGIFHGGCMALCHQERFVQEKQLHTYYTGDELSPISDGALKGIFSASPALAFEKGRLVCGYQDASNVLDNYGAVTGFIP